MGVFFLPNDTKKSKKRRKDLSCSWAEPAGLHLRACSLQYLVSHISRLRPPAVRVSARLDDCTGAAQLGERRAALLCLFWFKEAHKKKSL